MTDLTLRPLLPDELLPAGFPDADDAISMVAAEQAGQILGAAWLHKPSAAGDAYFRVMVRKDARRRGIGLRLVLRLAEEARGRGGLRLCTWFTGERPDISAFLAAASAVPAFDVFEMTYDGAPYEEPSFSFDPYRPADYDSVRTLLSAAFLPLRTAIGVRPHLIPPSEDDRRRLAECADSVFLLRVNGELAGMCGAYDDEVDDVAVAERFRGRGFAGALVAHATNHILARGKKPQLSVVGWNEGAHALYRHLGWQDADRSFFWRITL